MSPVMPCAVPTDQVVGESHMAIPRRGSGKWSRDFFHKSIGCYRKTPFGEVVVGNLLSVPSWAPLPEKAGRVFDKLFGFFFSPKRLKVWLHFWGSFLVMVVIVLDYLSRGIES